MALKKTYWVQKYNTLNQMYTEKCCLSECRFISIYLSRINHKDPDTRIVKFRLEEFQKIMGLKETKIKEISKVCDNLLGKIMQLPNTHGTPFSGFTKVQMFKKAELYEENGEWWVTMDAHDDVLPLFFEYKNHYFKYQLWNTLFLKSKNQVRMYEILKEFEYRSFRILTIEDLKNLLWLNKGEYVEYRYFKRDILEPCRKALSEHTDICFTYVPHGKRGARGKIKALKFSILKNYNHIDHLGLDEFIDVEQIKSAIAEEYSDTFNFSVENTENNIFNENIECIIEILHEEKFTFEEAKTIYLLTLDIPAYIFDGENRFGIKHIDWLNRKYSEMRSRVKSKAHHSRYDYFIKMLKTSKLEAMGEEVVKVPNEKFLVKSGN